MKPPPSLTSKRRFGRMVPIARSVARPRNTLANLRGRLPVLAFASATHAKSRSPCGKGTIFESSHLKLHLWLQGIHLMCASKKGISTRQIQRMLQCSMKTAWFLTHRIREAMRDGSLGPLGGEGKFVE